jgi:peptidoglycan/LPS O-acetylase OafA/YrhL
MNGIATIFSLEFTKKRRVDFPDGLRAIAALFVLFSHMWYQIWPAVLPPFGYGKRPSGLMLSITSWLYYGHFAVVVFIVLSGFCLMLPVVRNNGILRGGTLKFFKRRVRRILPPYYFAMVLSLLLINFVISDKTGTQWDISLPVTVEGIITHLFMFQDIATSTQINYVFWSIALEFHLYIFFPILVFLWQYLGGIKTTLLSGFFIYGIIILLEAMHLKEVPPQFIGLCFYFVLGMLGTSIVLAQNGPLLLVRMYAPWRIIFTLSIACIIYYCYVWGFDVVEERFAFLDTFCALATLSLLVTASSSGENIIRDFLSSKILVNIGTFSYSIYLIHAPILQCIWKYMIHPLHLNENQDFILLSLSSLPTIIILSYVFYLYCERPFLNPSVTTSSNRSK